MFAAQRGEIGDAGDVDAARILVSASILPKKRTETTCSLVVVETARSVPDS
jgi:hypothetical protein